MKSFSFKTPTNVVFGNAASLKLDELLNQSGYNKPIIITGSNVAKTEAFKNMCSVLGEAGFNPVVYENTVVDPAIEDVDMTAEVLKNNGCDVAIAVGGGSPIDTAKAACMLVTNEGSVRDYLFGGTKTVSRPSMPLICVPTTAGSGSEVTASSVITDNQNNIKLSVTSPYIYPQYAVVDPLMHMSMPAFITATTGMDALTHAIEAYVSLNASVFSDSYAETAIRLIGSSIRTATHSPGDIEARSRMALASVMAATAFANGGLGAVHGISQSIGGIAHVAHGLSNAMLLPHVMELNLKGSIVKFARIAELLGERTQGLSERSAAELAVSAVKTLSLDLKIPQRLRDVNVTKEMFPEIIKGTMGYRLLAVNPVKITEQDVLGILEEAF